VSRGVAQHDHFLTVQRRAGISAAVIRRRRITAVAVAVAAGKKRSIHMRGRLRSFCAAGRSPRFICKLGLGRALRAHSNARLVFARAHY
jgi:hypothetical protein